MGNNAVKSVSAEKYVEIVEFAWTQEDCDKMGINRAFASIAWQLLSTGKSDVAMRTAGYGESRSFDQISALPEFAHAMRVMSTQYLNSVITPQAIRALANVANDRNAAAAARVSAASKLLDHANESLDRLRGSTVRDAAEFDIDALAALIDKLERDRSANAKAIDAKALESVQIVGQTQDAESYLSDFM